MTKRIEFLLFSEAETSKVLGKSKPLKATLPKKSLDKSLFNSRFKDFQTAQQVAAPKIMMTSIKGVRLKAAAVAKIRAIHESATPTAEAIVNQKTSPDEILGTLYSSITAYEYTRMHAEFKQRVAKAKSPLATARVKAEWTKVVSGFQIAYAAAGIKGLKESDLQAFSKELSASKANFTAITNIYNSAVSDAAVVKTITGTTVALGGWVPQVAVLTDAGVVTTTINDLCSKPFAEGQFTKNFSKSFNLTVRLSVPCPTWTNPLRWCTKSFTLAGVSFSMGINVGYKVSCCGATVWGHAYAEACGTLLGIKFCAGCSGSIVGVSGIGRVPSGNNCIYGIGINAQLKCTFGGITVFQAQAPFGYNVTGPCPPAGLCP